MGTSTEELKARMKQLKFPGDDTGSFSPTPSPGGSLSARCSRPRPTLGLQLDSSMGLTSPITRRQGTAVTNLSAPLSRERLRFGTFPPPSQDEYERKLEDIMKLTGVLSIDGKKYKTPISDLEALGDLGNGTCGHVVKMKHKETGKIIACKQMRRTGNSEETKRIVMDMDVVLKSHDCREIVVCLGCFITASDVWICMELMATCFDKLLKQIKAPVPEIICGKVAVATLNALNYLKDSHGVIHRDVKPSNILLDYEGKVKLCDFGISGRLVDSKAKTRSAGCAAYMAPERINPPNPNKPDYDIRADVWSLGITLVELATGQFPYKDCKTEFEVLTKVIQDDPPSLPPEFSPEFRQFVHDCLLKNHKDRPKYKKLLEHPFIIKSREMKVDVGAWYYRVVNHSGDPNKVGDPLGAVKSSPAARKSSLEQRHEAQTFKPQPSPRMVKSWRMQNASQYNNVEDSKGSSQDSSLSRLKFYTTSQEQNRTELNLQKPNTSPRKEEQLSRYPETTSPHSPRYDNPRLQELSLKPYEYGAGSRLYDSRHSTLDGGRTNLNGSLSRNTYSPTYQGSAPSSYQSRPNYLNSRSHEDYSSALKSPQKRYEPLASHSETSSPREYTHSANRKYSFENTEAGKDHYTPKGTRKYESYTPDHGSSPRKVESPRKSDLSQDALQWPERGDSSRTVERGRESNQVGARKYPALPVPEQTSRGRDTSRESRNFLPSLKFSSWTLSSPLNFRRFRNSSSTDRTTNFEAARRLNPTYRSLNERDKHFYSSSGRSDKL